MSQLYQRGRFYWCKYYVDGRPVRESTGCQRETDACRFLRTREGALAAGAPIPPGPCTTSWPRADVAGYWT